MDVVKNKREKRRKKRKFGPNLELDMKTAISYSSHLNQQAEEKSVKTDEKSDTINQLQKGNPKKEIKKKSIQPNLSIKIWTY